MTTPILTGEHVELVPMTLDLLSQMQKAALDPSIWRYMNPQPKDMHQIEEWFQIALARPNSFVWATRLRSTGEAIGSTRYLDIDMTNRTLEIGATWLASVWRGSVFNPEAKLLQLTHAFEEMRMRRVALKTHHENKLSQAAILKLGAKFEGTFRNHILMADGSTRHTMWYSITEEEWPEVKAKLQQRIAL
jgi:RimJ/RimL family protein N-acetyltransferase